MLGKFYDIVERLRELDEEQKKRLIIWGSGVAVVCVIVLWVGYFSLSFQAVRTENERRVTMWERARGGVILIAETTARGARIVYSRGAALIQEGKTISIDDDRKF